MVTDMALSVTMSSTNYANVNADDGEDGYCYCSLLMLITYYGMEACADACLFAQEGVQRSDCNVACFL